LPSTLRQGEILEDEGEGVETVGGNSAGDRDAAGFRAEQPADDGEQGGFPATRRSHDDDDLAGANAQLDAVEHRQRTVGVAHPVDDQLHDTRRFILLPSPR
jgi:hypothetical protein